MLPLATFGNLFSGDGIIIFLVLLLLFGAKKLPELAKGLGSAVREFSKAKDEIHSEMTRAATPQPPQIAPPQYTQAQSPILDEHGHPVDHEHGYTAVQNPAPTVVGPNEPLVQKPADVMASTASVPTEVEKPSHPA